MPLSPRPSSTQLHARTIAKFCLNWHGQRNAIFRQYLFDLLARISPSVAIDANGIRYYLSTADKEVSRKTFMWGDFEQQKMSDTLRLIEDRTSRSMLGREWIDIGANIGTTTIPAVKLFGASHVWAFEPAPGNLTLLRCNLIVNDIADQVSVIPMALSNIGGHAELELSPTSWGDHRIVTSNTEGSLNEASRQHIEIEVARFDEVSHARGISLERVGLIWIDTQGHEGKVLAGAPSILESSLPVLAEYWPYGLRRAACLDLFHDIVETHYSSVIDIGSEGAPVEYPARRVGDLEKKYPALDFTDLLLL